jgi:hypothetical protein
MTHDVHIRATQVRVGVDFGPAPFDRAATDEAIASLADETYRTRCRHFLLPGQLPPVESLRKLRPEIESTRIAAAESQEAIAAGHARLRELEAAVQAGDPTGYAAALRQTRAAIAEAQMRLEEERQALQLLEGRAIADHRKAEDMIAHAVKWARTEYVTRRDRRIVELREAVGARLAAAVDAVLQQDEAVELLAILAEQQALRAHDGGLLRDGVADEMVGRLCGERPTKTHA